MVLGVGVQSSSGGRRPAATAVDQAGSRPSLMLMTHSAGQRTVRIGHATPGQAPAPTDTTADPTTTQHAAALTLGLAAPDAVVDPLPRAYSRQARRRGTRRRCAGPPGRRHRHSERRWTAKGPCTSLLPSSPCPWILQDPQGRAGGPGVRPVGTRCPVHIQCRARRPGMVGNPGVLRDSSPNSYPVTWAFLGRRRHRTRSAARPAHCSKPPRHHRPRGCRPPQR